jgi:hypothetical protein
MKGKGAVALYAVLAAAWASDFEPADFNVTAALIANGVDVAAIPGLAGLTERSAINACAVAVCCLLRLDQDVVADTLPV